MALAAANDPPQRTCTAALDRQICRSLLVMPPKEISLRPTPSFASIKRRKLLKVYYQQQTKRPTPQEVPNNNRPAPRSQVILTNAPIVSEVQEDDPQQASLHPTEIDVMIEVDVQIDEERKVNPPRAKKRVLGSHVDETACPDTTVKERGEYDRSKRLATTEAEADQEQMKLDVKKKDVKQQWASFLNWNNPRNKAKNYEEEESSFDSSSSSQVNELYERARRLRNEIDAEEERHKGEASEQQCGKTAAEETNTGFRSARMMNDYYEDEYENEIWSSYSNQCDNSTISSVEEKVNDEDEGYEGIVQTGPSQFEVYIDVDEWTKETVHTPNCNDWTMDSAYMNDELDSVNEDKCWEVQDYCRFQIAANKQYRLTQELFDRLKERGITIIKMNDSCRTRNEKKKPTTQSS